MIGVGETFPEFTLEGVDCNDDLVTETNDSVFTDHEWVIIYFYPKDFTFIWPTEIQGFDRISRENETNHELNTAGTHALIDVKVVGISPDNEYCKLAWKEQNPLIRNIEHTLLADSGNFLADELGIVSDAGVPYRATYIVNTYADNLIMHMSVNWLDTGRSSEEIRRTLMALSEGGLTGCEWQAGDELVA